MHTSDCDPLVTVVRSVAGVRCIRADFICQHIRREPWPYVCSCDLQADECGISGALVINRLFRIQETGASSLLNKMGVHESWFHYFVKRLTDRAATRVHDVGARGVSRSLLPLNSQWYLIGKALPNISTPSFIFGFNEFVPPMSGIKQPILKSVWSFSAWGQENFITFNEAKENQFFVEKPTGTPFIIAFIGSRHYIYFPRARTEIDATMIRDLVDSCKKIFVTVLGEIICYAGTDGRIMFCACSPYLGFSLQQNNFRDSVVDYCSRF